MEETNQLRNDENGELFGETDSDEDECRVCREKGGILICPCDCTGSMKYIHDHCLRRWVILKAGPLPVGAHGAEERGDIADQITDLLLAGENMESCFSCNVCLAPWKPWRKRQLRRSLVQMEDGEKKKEKTAEQLMQSSSFTMFMKYVCFDSPVADGLQECAGGGSLDKNSLRCWCIGILQRVRLAIYHVMKRQCCKHLGCVLLRIQIWIAVFVLCMILAKILMVISGIIVGIFITADKTIDSFIIPTSMASWFESIFPPLSCFSSFNRPPEFLNQFTKLESWTTGNDTTPISVVSSTPPGFLRHVQRWVNKRVLQGIPWFQFSHSAGIGAGTHLPSTSKMTNKKFFNNYFPGIGEYDDFLAANYTWLMGAGIPFDMNIMSIDIALAGALLLAWILKWWGPGLAILPRPIHDLTVLLDLLFSSFDAGFTLLLMIPLILYLMRLALHSTGVLSESSKALNLTTGDGFAFHVGLFVACITPLSICSVLLIRCLLYFQRWKKTALLQGFLSSFDCGDEALEDGADQEQRNQDNMSFNTANSPLPELSVVTEQANTAR